ncbi:MAG: uracil-DNA glycosylase [Chloroflexi bacterium]|nr:uracil-DNA glycosylase [Chloroflexota bacterium]
MLQIDKKQKFDVLVNSVNQCELCVRMRGRCKVLSERNGSLDSKVVFIGEAPGRLGADRTQTPFCGDQAGKNFERLLSLAGLSRTEVFITNTVLCNPRDEKGNNAPPTLEETRNCSLHLSLVLDIIHPELVVTLGQWALKALSTIAPHSIDLHRDVRKPAKWAGYVVLPVYHPGPRAVLHRSITNQFGDFYVLSDILGGRERSRTGIQKRQLPLLDVFQPSVGQKVIFRIVRQLGEVSKFKLAKLLYLLDWRQVRTTGDLLTGFYYIFQKNGPLATSLSLALDEMEGHELRFRWRGGQPIYATGQDIRVAMGLTLDTEKVIDDLVRECQALTDFQIKTKAYLTDPIRDILRRQKAGERMLNHPIFEGRIPAKPNEPE